MTTQNLPPRVRPWQRAVALALITVITYAPVGARGPGRPGVNALVDPPDFLPPTGANLPANFLFNLDPTLALPGNPTLPGALFDVAGPQSITISLDSVLGGPTGMTFGATMRSASGDLVVPLVGVTPDATVNGQLAIPAVDAHIGSIDLIPPLLSLKTVAIPPVLGLENFVRDKTAVIALGKALFWDAKVGSDGQACASCHFHAGTDTRLKNQLNPGQRGGDNLFNKTATGGGGPNYTLKPADFPFLRLLDPLDRNSPVVFETNDVYGSQGTFSGDFLGFQPNGDEKCANRPIDEFSVHGLLTRRVTPRRTPPIINAVFNYRSFWDGRANNVFNGNNPFGNRDTGAKVLEAFPDGSTAWVSMALRNASLASQAVGPALSDFEMTCANKTFKQLGRKMLPMRALSTQGVHPQDSVLAPYRDGRRDGLKATYSEMIQQAFEPNWWRATGKFDGYTQMESNFSMFWGLAIMMYESTLVSDDAPIDRFVGWAGTPADPNALSVQEKRGLALFRSGKTSCVECHRGAEFTSAGTNLQPNVGETNLVEHMFVGKGGQLGMYDSAFYNIGVRPTAEDLGVGATDPFGNSLSFSRQYLSRLRGNSIPDTVLVNPCMFAVKTDAMDCWTHPDPNMTRVAVDGAFKTPSLRNVALRQPYFHNGSRFTLEQVVEFYNRGGDRRGPDGNDTTGFIDPSATNGGTANVHPSIRPLGLTAAEKADLVAFLRNALTDRRVACEKAPFDHPELRVFNGHVGNEQTVVARKNDVKAVDAVIVVPPVGAKGLPKGACMTNDVGGPVGPVAQNGQQGRDDDDSRAQANQPRSIEINKKH
ncbi:cytochrome-c peroxidase [Polaromonas jejuensis]|uniref:Cytochrome-c peroxidase n=1 Tax=Polaromonas jejuensis TaxID=457502 RepID=A0ABW0QCW8_9BURK|nr:cytochrome c peroxidase [Polaromonas jejuensis]